MLQGVSIIQYSFIGVTGYQSWWNAFIWNNTRSDNYSADTGISLHIVNLVYHNVIIHLHFSPLADSLIQRDLALSALLKDTLADCEPSHVRDSNKNLSVTGPAILTARLPA
jgi:hypothetical protein